MIEEALTQARELAHKNRLEGKDLDELDELEDEEDEAFLDQYRYDGPGVIEYALDMLTGCIADKNASTS